MKILAMEQTVPWNGPDYDSLRYPVQFGLRFNNVVGLKDLHHYNSSFWEV
jgi:hypothetical protein